jgi:hypothetical protein
MKATPSRTSAGSDVARRTPRVTSGDRLGKKNCRAIQSPSSRANRSPGEPCLGGHPGLLQASNSRVGIVDAKMPGLSVTDRSHRTTMPPRATVVSSSILPIGVPCPSPPAARQLRCFSQHCTPRGWPAWAFPPVSAVCQQSPGGSRWEQDVPANPVNRASPRLKSSRTLAPPRPPCAAASKSKNHGSSHGVFGEPSKRSLRWKPLAESLVDNLPLAQAAASSRVSRRYRSPYSADGSSSVPSCHSLKLVTSRKRLIGADELGRNVPNSR